MAVVNTKATAVSNADTVPAVINNAAIARDVVMEAVGVVAVAAADDDNSVFRVARVPSNARITSLKLMNTAITAGTSYNIGIYQTAANGGAAVGSANQLAATLDLSSARAVPTEVLAVSAANAEKRLWEVLGLSADPGRDYDVALTGATVGSAAGTIAARIQFVV